jgi:predicted dehydrogenase
MRLAPSVVHLQRALDGGLLGELVHVRAWGKQDTRAGGEDMLVLGTHIFDLMRLFAGDASGCAARAFASGRDIRLTDAHQATERIGLVAGDEIEAQFRFSRGVTAAFVSRGRLRQTLGPMAMELLGSKGVVRVVLGIDPVVLARQQRQEASASPAIEEWVPLADDAALGLPPDQRGFGPANRRVVLDWLEAIEHNREPQCSGYNAMKALEMVMAVYQSALGRALVPIPLSRREHPLL